MAGTVDMGAYEASLETCGISGNQTYTFGDVEIFVQPGQAGNIACLSVGEVQANHPDAPPGLQTGVYWIIQAFRGNGTAASGYTVDLTITTPFTPDANDKLCREFNGGDWDCAADSFTATTITRLNVTAFSDWAAGNDVTPTSIRLSGAAVGPAGNTTSLLVVVLALLVGITAVVYLFTYRRRYRVRG